MTCPECHKFPAFELQEPESDLDLEGTVVSGNIRVVLNTECCGVEAKEYNFECDLDLGDAVRVSLEKAGIVAPMVDGVKTELDLTSAEISMDDDPDVTVDDYMRNTDRRGKVIRNPRYMKHMYRVTVAAKVMVTYPRNDEDGGDVVKEVTGEWSDECAASEMEELT